MKINLPKHEATETEDLKIKDIPLAYVNTENNEYHANVVIEKNFKKAKSKNIRPYDTFAEDNICVFDKEGNIAKINLQRNGNSYTYIPKSKSEFTPQEFSCEIILKHNIKYTTKKNFNINVRVSTSGLNEDLSERLIGIFGDAYKRGICPSNIKINHGRMSYGSMFTDPDEGENVDFVFIESTDGVHFKDNTKKNSVIDENSGDPEDFGTKIDVEYITQTAGSHVWLVTDVFENMLYQSDSATTTIKNPVVYKKTVYKNAKKIRRFYQNYILNNYGDYTQHFISDTILVLEKSGEKSIIVSPAEMFSKKNINKFAGLIYETLIYVYTHSYKKVKSALAWITDEPVDYAAFQMKRLNESHGKINLNQMLLQIGVNPTDTYQILSITCSNENVIFTGTTANGDMQFKKVTERDEPEKQADQISYYTTKGTVVLYKSESDYFWTEEKLLITEKVSGTEVFIQVNPYKNSKFKIFSDQPQELEIPNNTEKYILCTKPVNYPMTSIFQLVLKSTYDKNSEKESVYGIKIATVSVKSVTNTELTDLRILGGGLPEGLPDDYNLIDISNALGRPYHKNATLIIRLPKKYEKFEDRLRKEINKHISGGEYPVIIFEDREAF